ncbi:hypothetical protein SLS64_001226 [Diaporthe eres]|uniref:Uncharacterized protein n=1 Tax=Diaporthe eres TaxID=83184 RepID=A0ABR1PQZ7_DIAER
MGVININNISGHDQLFYIHGWGQNDTTVGAGQMFTFDAPDGTSGAIIAVHEGREGEQVEVTKAGWGGNDVFDTSVLAGSGGNITVQHWGNDSTRKGAPTYMQDAQVAWDNASQETRNAIQSAVILSGEGKVVYIGPTKENPPLENWVRTFANGKTYIGIGAWGDFKGDVNDNNQSSAAPGSQDIIITYNDGNANPTLGASGGSNAPETAAVFAFTTQEASAPEGPGIVLTNKSGGQANYNFYNNTANGDGWANPEFNNTTASVTLDPGQTQFVPLDSSFKGRVQRGTQQPATWVEFQLRADDGCAWGNISLIMGCDGAAMISATDGKGVSAGFTQDIVSGAPDAAKVTRGDGAVVLDTTQGYWAGGPNKAASDYELAVVGQQNAYVLGGSGTTVVRSENNRLAVDMY